jgi:hypothetical protein
VHKKKISSNFIRFDINLYNISINARKRIFDFKLKSVKEEKCIFINKDKNKTKLKQNQLQARN